MHAQDDDCGVVLHLTDISQIAFKSMRSYLYRAAIVTVVPPEPSGRIILVGWPYLKGRFPIIPVIQMQLSYRIYLAVTFLALRRIGSWSQIIDQAQDFPEQFLRHGHLS